MWFWGLVYGTFLLYEQLHVQTPHLLRVSVGSQVAATSRSNKGSLTLTSARPPIQFPLCFERARTTAFDAVHKKARRKPRTAYTRDPYRYSTTNLPDTVSSARIGRENRLRKVKFADDLEQQDDPEEEAPCHDKARDLLSTSALACSTGSLLSTASTVVSSTEPRVTLLAPLATGSKTPGGAGTCTGIL